MELKPSENAAEAATDLEEMSQPLNMVKKWLSGRARPPIKSFSKFDTWKP
jgi:hypothetical protein